MSGFLLDTNLPSELVRTLPEPKVRDWVAAQDVNALHLSVVSIGGFQKGLTLMPAGRRRTELEEWFETALLPLFSGRIFPVTQAISQRWGKLGGVRQLMGRPLNAPDGMIAATALDHGLIVVTRNWKDFEGLGVAILNPWNAS